MNHIEVDQSEGRGRKYQVGHYIKCLLGSMDWESITCSELLCSGDYFTEIVATCYYFFPLKIYVATCWDERLGNKFNDLTMKVLQLSPPISELFIWLRCGLHQMVLLEGCFFQKFGENGQPCCFDFAREFCFLFPCIFFLLMEVSSIFVLFFPF